METWHLAKYLQCTNFGEIMILLILGIWRNRSGTKRLACLVLGSSSRRLFSKWAPVWIRFLPSWPLLFPINSYGLCHILIRSPVFVVIPRYVLFLQLLRNNINVSVISDVLCNFVSNLFCYFWCFLLVPMQIANNTLVQCWRHNLRMPNPKHWTDVQQGTIHITYNLQLYSDAVDGA